MLHLHKNFFLFFLQLFFAAGILFSQSPLTVTRKIEKLYSGTGYLVTLKLHNNGVASFTKIREIVTSSAFKAEPILSAGATFAADNAQIKFVWVSLPEGDSLALSYKIYCSAPFSIKGTIIFIEDSRKREEIIMGDTIVSGNTTLSQEKEIVKDKPGLLTPDPVIDSIKVKQLISPAGASGEYFVTVVCRNVDLKSYVKIAYTVSNGSVLEIIEEGKSVSSKTSEEVKFIWVTFPKDSVVSVKFKVRVKLPEEKPLLLGNFYFVEDNVKRKYSIGQ